MPNPYLTQPIARRVLTLAGIYLSFILVIGDAVVYGTLLPIAMQELGGASLYALAAAVGGILGIVAMPLLGYLTTRYPHAKPILLAITLFVVVGVVAARGLAPTIEIFLAAKLFLAFGTAGCYVVGLPLIRDMFPVKRASVLLGAVGTASAIGMIAGPILLGAVIDAFGWRAVSLIVGPGLAIAGILVLMGARVTKAQAAAFASSVGRFDVLGAVLLTILITFLVLPLSLGTGLLPFGTLPNTLLFVGAALALGGLVAIVRRKKEKAFLPAAVFRDRNTVALMIQIFLGSASSLAVQTFVPLYILLVLGGTAVQAGIAASLYAIPAFIMGPFIGRWIGRTGTAAGVIKVFTVFKVVVMGVLGVWILAAGSSVEVWMIYVAMFLSGIYAAGQQGTTQTAPQIMIRPELRAQGTAATSMQLSLGPILGAATFGSLIVGLGPAIGIAVAVLAAAAMGALSILPAFWIRPLTGADSVEVAEVAEERVEARAEETAAAGPARKV